MSAGWVAGSVRARALARRRIGPELARRLAGCGSLDEATQALTSSPYRRQVRAGQSLAEAQHAAAAAVLWNLRVLAGWLPRSGVRLMRVMAGWFEIANTDEALAGLTGGHPGTAFEVGSLATAWPSLRVAGSTAAIRSVLAASAWGDPGGDSIRDIRVGMRLRWAAAVAALGADAAAWGAGAAGLTVAGLRFASGAELPPQARGAAAGLLGVPALTASALADFTARLPAHARWALTAVAGPEDLWRAEAAWWARVEADGNRLLQGPGAGRGPVLGCVAALAADAFRVRAALELAARGGEPMDAYDAVA